MLDTYFPVACIILLGCLVAAVLEIRKRGEDIDNLIEITSDLQAEINSLDAQLFLASKNDQRDARGRFTRAA